MSRNVHLYGIKNCDTVRKAMRWLSEKDIDSEFHDLKKDTLESSLIQEWLSQVGEDKLINRRSLTWRNIPSEDKKLNDEKDIIALIQAYPTVVKRPIIYNGVHWSAGFNDVDWNQLFL